MLSLSIGEHSEISTQEARKSWDLNQNLNVHPGFQAST